MTAPRRMIDGTRLRVAYEDGLGLNRPMFAKRCEISVPYLLRIERGERRPSPMVLARIARELGVHLDEISTRMPVEDAGTSGRLIVRVCYRCDYSFASTEAATVALWEDEHDAQCPRPAPVEMPERAA